MSHLSSRKILNDQVEGLKFFNLVERGCSEEPRRQTYSDVP